MTIQEAIYILDPKTTADALKFIDRVDALAKVNEACEVACECMRKELRNDLTESGRNT